MWLGIVMALLGAAAAIFTQEFEVNEATGSYELRDNVEAVAIVLDVMIGASVNFFLFGFLPAVIRLAIRKSTWDQRNGVA